MAIYESITDVGDVGLLQTFPIPLYVMKMSFFFQKLYTYQAFKGMLEIMGQKLPTTQNLSLIHGKQRRTGPFTF